MLTSRLLPKHTIAALRVVLQSPMVSLSAFASLSLKHLPPQDTINAIVKSADGSHGIVEMTFGAPVPSRADEANNGISVTGTEGWIWIELVESKTEAKRYVFRITVKTVKRNEKGEDVGETEEVAEERECGVEEEFRSFFTAVGGYDDGFGTPFSALQDVAWIEAALTSNGYPVDLVKLVGQ